MNKLFTPPGYVEYPRDPKYRLETKGNRLQRLATGFANLRWGWVSILFMSWTRAGQVSWLVAMLLAVIFLLIASEARQGVSEIFRVKGLPKSYSFLPAGAVGILGVLFVSGVPGHLVFGLLLALCWSGLYVWAYAIVYKEFRRFDPELPLLFGSRRLGEIIGKTEVIERLKARGVEVQPEVQ